LAPAPEIVRLSNGPAPASTEEMTPQGKIAAALARAGIRHEETWTAAGGASRGSSLGASTESPRKRAAASDVPTQSATLHIPPPASVPTLSLLETASGDHEAGSQAGSGPAPPLIMMKGEDNPTFVISRQSQKELAGSLGWRSVSMIVGGAALATFGLYVLLFQRHFR